MLSKEKYMELRMKCNYSSFDEQVTISIIAGFVTHIHLMPVKMNGKHPLPYPSLSVILI